MASVQPQAVMFATDDVIEYETIVTMFCFNIVGQYWLRQFGTTHATLLSRRPRLLPPEMAPILACYQRRC